MQWVKAWNNYGDVRKAPQPLSIYTRISRLPDWCGPLTGLDRSPGAFASLPAISSKVYSNSLIMLLSLPSRPSTPTRVAVAGVTNGVGQAIVSALLDQPDIQVVLLARQPPFATDLTHFTSRGAILHRVDYTLLPQLVSALLDVQTVITTIFSDPDITPSINLIRASKAAGVRRFATSEFAFSSKTNRLLDLYEPQRRIWAELKESGLECTAFQNGIIMDHFAHGAPKEYDRPLEVFPFIVDIAQRKASIPGTGHEPVTFTSLHDVGRLVAAAVKLKGRWPEELGMQGETTSYNRVVQDVEAVTREKINVEYITKVTLSNMLEDASDAMAFFHAQVLNVIADGLGVVSPDLNKLVPNVSVMCVKDFISDYWNRDRTAG